MADQQTYLQAASVETLAECLFTNSTHFHFHEDGRQDWDGDLEVFREHVRLELLRRFSALEAERDRLRQEKLALIVQLGTARGLLRQGRKWSQVLMPNSFTGKPQPWNAEVDAFLSRKEEEAPGHDDR